MNLGIIYTFKVVFVRKKKNNKIKRYLHNFCITTYFKLCRYAKGHHLLRFNILAVYVEL